MRMFIVSLSIGPIDAESAQAAVKQFAKGIRRKTAWTFDVAELNSRLRPKKWLQLSVGEKGGERG